MSNQLPNEATDAIVNETEKLIFPKPAKTIAGKVLRFLFKIGKVFVPKKNE